jgi:hypothetical protein
MRCIVYLSQMLKIEVGVYLGGAYIAMAEQLLHRSQVAG